MALRFEMYVEILRGCSSMIANSTVIFLVRDVIGDSSLRVFGVLVRGLATQQAF
jgi:hypothetical protein